MVTIQHDSRRLIQNLQRLGLALACIITLSQARPAQAEPSPQLSRQELLKAVDIDHPAMAKVRDALGGKDTEKAIKALVHVLRTYEQPINFGQKIRPDPRRRAPAGAGAVQNTYNFFGIAHTFEKEIDWDFNPNAKSEASGIVDVDTEWTRHLNRHNAWAGMAVLYENWRRETDAYPKTFAKLVRSWVEAKPKPAAGPARDAYSAWLPLDAGLRMTTTWPPAWLIFRSSDDVPDDVILDMAASFIEHARYLKKHPGHSSERTVTMNGLLRVGLLFPFFREAKSWREYARDQLMQSLEHDVYPDGAHVELSPRLHIRTLGNLIAAHQVAHQAEFKMPERYVAGVERMTDYLLWSMRPDGMTPAWNDSPPIFLRPVFQHLLRFLPHREGLRWFLSQRRRGKVPDHTSHIFPYAGQVTMRTTWYPHRFYLAFDAGPMGVGNAHEDKLGIVLYAYGRDLLVEGGYYALKDKPWHEYFRSSAAHNVVLVDGKGQARSGVERTYKARAENRLGFRTDEQVDYARGEYNGGYGSKDYRPAAHRREVLFIKQQGLFVVRDTLTPRDEKSHRYSALFHLNAPENEPGTNADVSLLAVETAFPEGAQLRVLGMQQKGLTLRILTGQKKPTVRGFMAAGVAHRTVRPIPTAIYELEAKKPVVLVTALQPLPSAEAKLPTNMARLKLIRQGTDKDTYELIDETGRTITARFAP